MLGLRSGPTSAPPSSTTLAERILAAAAQGERDRERLLDAALSEYITEEA